MERLLHPKPRIHGEILLLVNIPTIFACIVVGYGFWMSFMTIGIVNAFLIPAAIVSFPREKTTRLDIINQRTLETNTLDVKEIAVVGIPVEGNGNKYVRGFKTNDDKTYLLPTKDIELFISSKDGKEIVMVEESGSDEGIHRRWLEDVFPPDIYESPEKLSKLDANLVLLRPSKPMNKT